MCLTSGENQIQENKFAFPFLFLSSLAFWLTAGPYKIRGTAATCLVPTWFDVC